MESTVLFVSFCVQVCLVSFESFFLRYLVIATSAIIQQETAIDFAALVTKKNVLNQTTNDQEKSDKNRPK